MSGEQEGKNDSETRECKTGVRCRAVARQPAVRRVFQPLPVRAPSPRRGRRRRPAQQLLLSPRTAAPAKRQRLPRSRPRHGRAAGRQRHSNGLGRRGRQHAWLWAAALPPSSSAWMRRGAGGGAASRAAAVLPGRSAAAPAHPDADGQGDSRILERLEGAALQLRQRLGQTRHAHAGLGDGAGRDARLGHALQERPDRRVPRRVVEV